jgi:NAD(P)-dependent dehydrogenase (short-subunit alcohol dehydrogenase family)
LVGGWIGGKPLAQLTDDDRMLDQHVWTTFYLSHTFVPKLIENKWGRIVIVSSPNAYLPPANGMPYSVAKTGQESLILTLAEELKGSGVTANILRVRSINLDHVIDQISSTKTRGWTTPEEITAATMYLCLDEAANLNGARIPLYGGP